MDQQEKSQSVASVGIHLYSFGFMVVMLSICSLLIARNLEQDAVDLSQKVQILLEQEHDNGHSIQKREVSSCACVPGLPGPIGKRGKKGSRGLQGYTGIPGVKGSTYCSGSNPGLPGIPGLPGFKGDRGFPGPSGMPGFDGPPGLIGLKGDKGDSCTNSG